MKSLWPPSKFKFIPQFVIAEGTVSGGYRDLLAIHENPIPVPYTEAVTRLYFFGHQPEVPKRTPEVVKFHG